MERSFITKFTFTTEGIGHKKSEKPSLTVPDQSYSVQELIEKFTRNIPVPISQIGNYDEEPDFDNIDPSRLSDYDLTTLQDMQIEYQSIVQNINEEIKKHKDQKVIPEPDVTNTVE